MSHWLDDAARGLSDGRFSRRQVLRRGGAVAIGTLTASVTGPMSALTSAAGARGTHHCPDGHRCKAGTTCCKGDCCEDSHEQCCDGECNTNRRTCCGKDPARDGTLCHHGEDCCRDADRDERCYSSKTDQCCHSSERVCPNGKCCGTDDRCVEEGEACCDDDQIYDRAREKCCMGKGRNGPEAAPRVCLKSQKCCNDEHGAFCCDSQYECCGGQCCDFGDCFGGTCCNPVGAAPNDAVRSVGCGGQCCAPGSICCGSTCCASGKTCVNGVCQTAGCGVGPACASGEICCDGVCCASGQICCGGVACCDNVGGACCPAAEMCCNTTMCCEGDCVGPAGQVTCCGATPGTGGGYASPGGCSEPGETGMFCCQGGGSGCVCNDGTCCTDGCCNDAGNCQVPCN